MAGPARDSRRYQERIQKRSRVEAYIRGWRDDDRWGRFFYPANRCVTELFRLGADDRLVVHETHECLTNQGLWVPADSSFWSNRRGTTVGEFWHGCDLRVTDPRAPEVLRGTSQARLEKVIDQAIAEPGTRSVVVHQGCLPLLMGDNPTPALRRGRGRGLGLYWLAPTNDFKGYTAQLIRDRLARVSPPDHHRDPRGVAVVGGGSPAENAELLALLSRVGLHPTGVVLPDVSFATFTRVAEASLFAWANRSALRDASDVVFQDLPVRLLMTDAPMGVEGTLGWLAECLRAADLDLGPLHALRAEAPWADALAALKQRASRWTLGLVVDPEEFELLRDTRPGFAFSLVAVLLEMGFGVRFLGRGTHDVFREPARMLSASGRRVELEVFGDPAGLARLLRQPDLGAVYSSFTADPRAAHAGKLSFSEEHLEMGFDGFLRSIERLLDLCERRPLSRFSSYLEG